MNRHQIEQVYVGVLLFITTILFYFVPMGKVQFVMMHPHPVYLIIGWINLGALLLFNHFVIKYSIVSNILLSCFIMAVAVILSKMVFFQLWDYLERADKQITPFGWQFKYKWYNLLIDGIFLVIGTEMMYLITKNKKSFFRRRPVPNTTHSGQHAASPQN